MALPPNPFIIDFRPFAVEPGTGLMLPDGLFDASVGRLDIKFHIRNTSTTKYDNVVYALETFKPRDFVITGARQGVINDLMPGASVLVHFEADFSNAAPGEKELMIWIDGKQPDCKGEYFMKKIFVTKTTFDPATKIYTCDTGRGKMQMVFDQIAVSPEIPVPQTDYRDQLPRIFIPLKTDTTLVPSKPVLLPFDCIPFEDPLPLWKAIAALIAALAALGAAIFAAQGKGTADIKLDCKVQPDGSTICDPLHAAGKGVNEKFLIGSILSSAASLALKVALKHYRDPWLLGRESVQLKTGEAIITEDVSFNQQPVAPIRSGFPYAVDVEWNYVATTNQNNTYSLTKTERTLNTDLTADAYVAAPATVHGLSPIKLGLKPLKAISPEIVFGANELYCYCLLVSPSPLRKVLKIELEDNGIKYDDLQNDGWFGGGVHLEEMLSVLTKDQMRGEWTAYFFAQVINLTADGATPEEATGFFGGDFIVNPFHIVYNQSSCPIEMSGDEPKFIKTILVEIP